MEVTNLTKRKILESLERGKRFDNRGLFDYRDLSIETGISKNAEGSARVKLGETEILAGVKLSLGEPYTDSPNSGVLVVTTELSPMASEKFEPGPPQIESIELARIIDRGVRESGMFDFEKLCIKEGELVWLVNLDIYPVNDAGNLIDAGFMAAIAAIQQAVLPKLEKENDKERILFGEFTTKKLPLTEKIPLALTFHKIGKNIFLDPTTEEEESSESRITIEISTDKKEDYINAVQKGGDDPFTVEEMHEIIDAAFKNYKKLKEVFNKELKKAK
jgi:exosome complex component RRP42